jgi:hypothetical protein
MGNKNLKKAAIAAFFLIVIIIMFKGALWPRAMLFGNDTITIYMAFAVFAKKMMTIYHSLPAWLPNICLGMPMIGSSSLLFFYPTDFLFMLLPFPLQYMYVPDLIIHMFVAALGMYLFLRKLKLDKPASLFGASAIMLSGYLISYVYAGHWNNIKAGALIPLAFYFSHRALEEKRLLHCLNAALIFALMMLATGMQIMAYTFLAVILYAGYYAVYVETDKKHRIRIGAGLAACAVFILLFSAPQFVPSIFYTNHSWRGDVSYKMFISWSFHPMELVTFLFPQFYGLYDNTYWGHMPLNLTTYYFGLLPLMLLAFLTLKSRHKKNTVFFAAASVIFLVLAFGGYTFVYALFYFVPVFKQFRNPSRFLYLATFFVVVLASMGLDNLLDEKRRKENTGRLKWAAAGMAAVLALVSLVFFSGAAESMIRSTYVAVRNRAIPTELLPQIAEMIRQDLAAFLLLGALILASLLLIINGKIKSAFIAALVLASINFIDVNRINSKFVTFEDYEKYIPEKNGIADLLNADKGPYRTANFDMLFSPNRGIYYGVENLSGMHGLMPADYRQMELAKCWNNININRQFNIRYYFNGEDLKIPGFVKIMEKPVMLFKDTYARERVFFSDSIMKVGSQQEMLDFMMAGNYNGDAVLVGPDFPVNSYQQAGGGSEITEYSPNVIKANVGSKAGGVLVHAAGFFNEWKTTVDGKQEKLYRVNYLAMGVPVPPGAHTVVFYYDDTEIRAGMLIGLLSLLFYIAVLIYDKRKRAA